MSKNYININEILPPKQFQFIATSTESNYLPDFCVNQKITIKHNCQDIGFINYTSIEAVANIHTIDIENEYYTIANLRYILGWFIAYLRQQKYKKLQLKIDNTQFLLIHLCQSFNFLLEAQKRQIKNNIIITSYTFSYSIIPFIRFKELDSSFSNLKGNNIYLYHIIIAEILVEILKKIPGVEVILGLGSIAREWADEWSDIDIAIIGRGLEINFPWKGGRILQDVHIDLYLVDLDTEDFSEWDACRRQEFEESIVLYTKDKNIISHILNIIVLKEDERIKKIHWLVLKLGWMGFQHTHWYNNKKYGYYWWDIPNLWNERGCLQAAHTNIDIPLDYTFQLLFLVNLRHIPDQKWRRFLVDYLPWLPNNFQKVLTHIETGKRNDKGLSIRVNALKIIIDNIVEYLELSNLIKNNFLNYTHLSEPIIFANIEKQSEKTISLIQILDNIPKVELHLHLEGAIPLTSLWQLIQKYDAVNEVGSFDDLKHKFRYKYFSHFLDIWDWKNNFLREYEDLTFIAGEVAQYLSNQNIIYAEVFYSPSSLMRHGLESQKITEAIRKGLDKYSDVITINLVTDLSRDCGSDQAMKWLKEISEVKELGIIGIGIGIGGSEHLFPPELFQEVYDQERNYGFKTSAHAGEVVGVKSIWGAIKSLKVDRIGHGITAIEDPELIDFLREKQLPLEICPISNLRTGIIQDLQKHPIKQLYNEGLMITVNTDDPTMFMTSLVQEYTVLIQELGFSIDDIIILINNAIQSAWCSQTQKNKLYDNLQNFTHNILINNQHLI